MDHRSSLTRKRLKERGNELRRVTTSSQNKTWKNSRSDAHRQIKTNRDASLPFQSRLGRCSPPTGWNAGRDQKGTGPRDRRKAERAFAGAGECHRATLRLRAAVAEAGALFKTRSGRGAAAGPRACHGGFGRESELRRAGASGVRREDSGKCRGR